jgi:hypothetical protein
MPAQDRVGSDEEDRPAFMAEHGSERGVDGSVVGFEARTCNLAVQDGELVAQQGISASSERSHRLRSTNRSITSRTRRWRRAPVILAAHKPR